MTNIEADETQTKEAEEVEKVNEAAQAEEKTAAPLELFFDLVFVFAITQVVKLIVGDLTSSGVARGVVVLGILWWAWGNWTWTTNAIDLEPRIVRAAVLVSMVGIFVMAQTVPFAYEGKGLWLAFGYLGVKLIAALLFFVGTKIGGSADELQHRAIGVYLPASFVGPGLVIAGTFMGNNQQWWWVAALVVEIGAAFLAGRQVWKIDAGHFAERHGLIIIIALGEAIIVVGSTLSEREPSLELAILLATGLAGACSLWWAYFDRVQAVWEHGLRDASAAETGRIARDVYSILHFPIIVGIVLYAVALEEAFLHPDEPLDEVVGVIFVLALGLYLLGQAAATFRTHRIVLWERIGLIAVLSAVVKFWTEGTATQVIVSSTLLLVATLTVEYVRFRPMIRGTAQVET